MLYCLIEYTQACRPLVNNGGGGASIFGVWVCDVGTISEARDIVKLLNPGLDELVRCVYRLGDRYFTLYSSEELAAVTAELSVNTILPLDGPIADPMHEQLDGDLELDNRF